MAAVFVVAVIAFVFVGSFRLIDVLRKKLKGFLELIFGEVADLLDFEGLPTEP